MTIELTQQGKVAITGSLMGMSKPNLMNCATFQRAVKLAGMKESSPVAAAFDAAVIAAVKMGVVKEEPATTWRPFVQPKEPAPVPRPKCTQHIEMWHTFSDGTTWVRCRHVDCTLGIDRKTHIDGVKAGTLYFVGENFKDTVPGVTPEISVAPQADEEVEPQIDECPSLVVDSVVPVAGQDDPEVLSDDTSDDIEKYEEFEEEFA